jgi:hypothetical protein
MGWPLAIFAMRLWRPSAPALWIGAAKPDADAADLDVLASYFRWQTIRSASIKGCLGPFFYGLPVYNRHPPNPR